MGFNSNYGAPLKLWIYTYTILTHIYFDVEINPFQQMVTNNPFLFLNVLFHQDRYCIKNKHIFIVMLDH